MAEIKFNFYNIYSNYYRNINDVKIFNIFIKPYYELMVDGWLFAETFTLNYRIELYLYFLYELKELNLIKYNICKSLKKINRKKIFVKKIFQIKVCDHKIYNLFRL